MSRPHRLRLLAMLVLCMAASPACVDDDDVTRTLATARHGH